MTDLHIKLVTPDRVVFDDAVGLVEVPGTNGRFTLLRNHGAIISALVPGTIRIIGRTGGEYLFECNGGYLECEQNRVFILANKIKSLS